MTTATVVAKITTTEPKQISRPHESAAQHFTVMVPAGTYPVELRTNAYDGRRYLAAVFSGTVTASGYGHRRYDSEIGKPGDVVLSPYKYQLRDGNFVGSVEILNAEALASAQGA